MSTARVTIWYCSSVEIFAFLRKTPQKYKKNRFVLKIFDFQDLLSQINLEHISTATGIRVPHLSRSAREARTTQFRAAREACGENGS